MKLLAALLALQSPPVAIVNVNVVPMDRERILAGQAVVIEGGRISWIGPAAAAPVPAGAITVDGAGKYLLPGLVDVHVHLASNPEPQQRALLTLFVVNGVTAVLNMRGTPQLLEQRAAVADGRIVGPTIYTVGPYVNEPVVTTPVQVESAVVAQRRAGYDFVKMHGNLSRPAYARLSAVGRREGIRIIGHAPRNLDAEAMFEERQYAVAHAEEFLYDRNGNSTDSSLPAVEARIPEFARGMARARIWLMPNLTAYKIIGLMAKDLDAVLARPELMSWRSSWGRG
jgi:dihydroorotase-like cyclic amidohydrolase